MKKIYTLLVSSLFSLSLLAFDDSSMGVSAGNSNMKLKVEVDGQRVRMAGNSITLKNLDEGNHNVRIYRARKKDNFTDRFGQEYEIIYATSVYLDRDYQVDIIIDRSGKVFMDAYRVASHTDCDAGTNGAYGYNGSDGNTNADSYANVMSTREFNQVTEQIRKEWFEANKLISVKTIIDKNNFTTAQVKDLMLLFSFESNKLEVLKYAYCKIVDKQNVLHLNDALTFSSSKDELARFIRESQ